MKIHTVNINISNLGARFNIFNLINLLVYFTLFSALATGEYESD